MVQENILKSNWDTICGVFRMQKKAIWTVCSGFRCNGADYAEIIKEFDVAQYKISNYEVIEETESICQIHYVIDLTVADRKNADLEGVFHITSTWKKVSDK